MKTKLKMMLLAFAAVSVNLHAVPQAPSAPLPQFMDKEQLTQWSASQSATAKVASSSQDTSTQFYTGKPYVADAGGYVFKYRTYNPEMVRWTSADPSGFPNGANNQFYAPLPTCSFDAMGTFYSGTPYTGVTVDQTAWNYIEGNMGSIYPLAVEAMNHADGTQGGNWTLSSSDISAIQTSWDYAAQGNPNSYYQLVQNALGNPSAGPDSTPVTSFLFTHGTDEYYAFGHANLSTSGTVTIDPTTSLWTYTATVTLSDTYTFAGYSSIGYFTPTGLGYRLQSAGYLQAFSSSGTWTDTWTE